MLSAQTVKEGRTN